MMPNGGSGSNPSSRRPSLRPPSPGSDAAVAQSQSRRGSKVLFDTKTPPSILRWEILNRVAAVSQRFPAISGNLMISVHVAHMTRRVGENACGDGVKLEFVRLPDDEMY